MKVLFIGGPNDGRREFLANGVPPYIDVYVHDMIDPNGGIQKETYSLKRSGKVYLAVHSSVTDINDQLVRGYRYARKRNPRRKLKPQPFNLTQYLNTLHLPTPALP